MPTILDISPPLSHRLGVWPGDVPFSLERSLSHEAGDGMRLSSLRTTLHAGAHADAPSHVEREGLSMHEVGLEPYVGACEVVEVRLPAGACILPEHLPGPLRAPRVLFKTGSDPASFTEDFVALSPELVRCLKAQDCVLAGIDTLSVDPFSSETLEAHHALFEAGMRILEGLDLRAVEPGLYTLIALPLRIEDGDGSPVRAVLLKA